MRHSSRLSLALSCAVAFLVLGIAVSRAAESVRLTLLASGTAQWEVDVIKAHGFDAKYGVDIEVTEVANKDAADIALLGGGADAIVTDWIWVNRERAAGKVLSFAPYSNQVGAVLTKGDSAVRTLADLKGKTIGIAGGPLDKSWILIQALARKSYGLDLAKEATPVFGAPPLLGAKFQSGEIDAVITFWQFAARLEAAGARPVTTVADAATALGLKSETPLLGFAFQESWAKAHPGALKGLLEASREAKASLAISPEEWRRLKPRIKPADDAELERLRANFIAGIPRTDRVDEANAGALLAALAEIGGSDLVGEGRALDPGVFFKFQ